MLLLLLLFCPDNCYCSSSCCYCRLGKQEEVTLRGCLVPTSPTFQRRFPSYLTWLALREAVRGDTRGGKWLAGLKAKELQKWLTKAGKPGIARRLQWLTEERKRKRKGAFAGGKRLDGLLRMSEVKFLEVFPEYPGDDGVYLGEGDGEPSDDGSEGEQ